MQQGWIHLLAALIVLASAAHAEEAAIPGVIYSAETVERWGYPPGPYWTPSEKDVLALEAELPAFLAAHWPGNRRPALPLGDYKRQYLGIERNRAKTIFVNAFCKGYWSRTPDWSEDFVSVTDGGSCFFQVYYDTGTRRFEDLLVHGDA